MRNCPPWQLIMYNNFIKTLPTRKPRRVRQYRGCATAQSSCFGTNFYARHSVQRYAPPARFGRPSEAAIKLSNIKIVSTFLHLDQPVKCITLCLCLHSRCEKLHHLTPNIIECIHLVHSSTMWSAVIDTDWADMVHCRKAPTQPSVWWP